MSEDVEKRSGGAEKMMVQVWDQDGALICDAGLSDDARKVNSLRLDDERQARAFIGLNVLVGCVTAVLKAEFDERNAVSQRRTTTNNRPDVPICEGGCE
jgi:hypothetical protein